MRCAFGGLIPQAVLKALGICGGVIVEKRVRFSTYRVLFPDSRNSDPNHNAGALDACSAIRYTYCDTLHNTKAASWHQNPLARTIRALSSALKSSRKGYP